MPDEGEMTAPDQWDRNTCLKLAERWCNQYNIRFRAVPDAFGGMAVPVLRKIIAASPINEWTLATFAHEVGHLINSDFDKPELVQEVNAWKTAQRLIEAVGLPWTKAMEANKRSGLKSHHQMGGFDD